MRKPAKKYDKKFKIDTVEFYLNSNLSMKKVSNDFGIAYQTFCGWVQEYKKSGQTSFKGKGVIKDSNEEVIVLRKRLADVTLERDILKKAAAIFLSPKK